LYVTRPDPRTKSVHVEIERTSLRPDKVRIAYLSETRADRIGLCLRDRVVDAGGSPTKSRRVRVAEFGVYRTIIR